MTKLPKKIGPIQPDSTHLRGIIYTIKKYYPDPASSNIVAAFPASTYGDTNRTLMWDIDWVNNGNSYLEIKFIDRYIFPTHYEIQGASASKEWNYQKEWNVYGYNESERSNSLKWQLLSTDVSNASTFCGNGNLCSGKGITIFPTSVRSINGFRYIRFVTTKGSNANNHFVASAVEFYGELSISGVIGKLSCTKVRRCNQQSVHVITLALILII